MAPLAVALGITRQGLGYSLSRGDAGRVVADDLPVPKRTACLPGGDGTRYGIEGNFRHRKHWYRFIFCLFPGVLIIKQEREKKQARP